MVTVTQSQRRWLRTASSKQLVSTCFSVSSLKNDMFTVLSTKRLIAFSTLEFNAQLHSKVETVSFLMKRK